MPNMGRWGLPGASGAPGAKYKDDIDNSAICSKFSFKCQLNTFLETKNIM
jgi:hypothetical protein